MEGRLEYGNSKISKLKTGGVWGGGILGLGILACLGCCLAPIAGVLAAGGIGLTVAGISRSLPWILVAGFVVAGAVLYLAKRSKAAASCGNPDCECAGSCTINPTDTHGAAR